MTTCEALQNRLLAEADPLRPVPELRTHVKQCGGCRDFLRRYESLAASLASLPVPPSDLAKLEFTQSLTNAGPIIRSMPRLAAGGLSLSSLLAVAAKPLAGVAAAVAVGVGIWAAIPGRRAVPEYAAPRHDLLRKVVAGNASLAHTSDPKARIALPSALAGDLQLETHDVLKAAPEDDLNALAAMYENVVYDGLVLQARQLDQKSPKLRHEVLSEAAEQLSTTMDAMTDLARTAPPQAQPALKRIAAAAGQGRTRLLQIARGEEV